MPYLTPQEREEIDQILIEATPLWIPIPGPQLEAYESKADVLFYGGAAGGGKTDLAIGLALTRSRRAMIYRREAKQLHAIIDRMADILGSRRGFNSTTGIWRLPGRQVELGGVKDPGDERSYQGRAHDLKVFDEIAHFHEQQFRFLCGWLRTTNSEVRTRILCTGNPPTDAEGEWIIRYFAPWLDPAHPNPAAAGELRWFAMIDGKEVEVYSGDEIEHCGESIKPQSRSFIPSRVEDNPFLMETGYKAMLQSLPEPLRSQMLKGDFNAACEDDPWQLIPTAWVKAAQDRWRAEGRNGRKMSSLGLDIARGGRDFTVIAVRYGDWFDELRRHPGKSTPDGPSVAALAVAALRDGAPVHLDVIGVGASVYDHLKQNNIYVVPLNGASSSEAHDRSGKLTFLNRRAELWWRLREALDPSYDDAISLPPDSELCADLCAPRWSLTARGVRIEAKDEIHKRLGRSPDAGDAVAYALVESLRLKKKNMIRTTTRNWQDI